MTEQILALDYGLKRIGVAVGNSLTGNAQALCTIHTDMPVQVPDELLKIIQEWQPNKIVMGMPYNNDGTPSSIAGKIRSFAAMLSEKIEMPIEFIDESFTSHEASQQLTQMRRSGARTKRVTKGDIDKAAAALVLQRWLDQKNSV